MIEFNFVGILILIANYALVISETAINVTAQK